MDHPERLSPDGSIDDGSGDVVLLPEPEVNRYAVPLTTLVGGAFVAHADQVVIHPQPSGEAPGFAGGGLGAVDGGDGD